MDLTIQLILKMRYSLTDYIPHCDLHRNRTHLANGGERNRSRSLAGVAAKEGAGPRGPAQARVSVHTPAAATASVPGHLLHALYLRGHELGRLHGQPQSAVERISEARSPRTRANAPSTKPGASRGNVDFYSLYSDNRNCFLTPAFLLTSSITKFYPGPETMT